MTPTQRLRVRTWLESWGRSGHQEGEIPSGELSHLESRRRQVVRCPGVLLVLSGGPRSSEDTVRSRETSRGERGDTGLGPVLLTAPAGTAARHPVPPTRHGRGSGSGLPEIRARPQISFLSAVQQGPRISSGPFPALNPSVAPHCLPNTTEGPSASGVPSLPVHCVPREPHTSILRALVRIQHYRCKANSRH